MNNILTEYLTKYMIRDLEQFRETSMLQNQIQFSTTWSPEHLSGVLEIPGQQQGWSWGSLSSGRLRVPPRNAATLAFGTELLTWSAKNHQWLPEN